MPGDFTQAATDTASLHGFEPMDQAISDLAFQGGSRTAFVRHSVDGSYWLVTPAFLLEIGDADPDEHEWFIGRYATVANATAHVIVQEPLPLPVLMAEHGRIPIPCFDSDGQGVTEEFQTWIHLARRGSEGTLDMNDLRLLHADPSISLLAEAGFEVKSVGDGCTLFRLEDEDSQTVWELEGDFGVYSHPLSGRWSLTRRHVGGHTGSASIERSPLLEIATRYRDLTVVPVDNDCHSHFDTWAEFDQSAPADRMQMDF